jgi:hypothetical protein
MWQSTTSVFTEVWLRSLAFDTHLASGLMPDAPKGMVHAKVSQKLLKSNKLGVLLVSNNEFWTLHLRLQAITNAIRKQLVHVLLFYSSPPNRIHIYFLMKPFSFVWYVIPLLKTGALASTRDLLRQDDNEKTCKKMAYACPMAYIGPNTWLMAVFSGF